MASAATGTQSAETTTVARPRWLLLSYVITAFTLVTVGMSLFFSHQLIQNYRRALAVDQEWAKRLEEYAALGQLATLIHTPIQAVFASSDVEIEAARMHMFMRLFNTHMARLRQEVQTHVSPARVVPLLEDLNLIRDALAAMVQEADLIYAALRRHDPVRAQRRLARINHLYANATTALEALREDVGVIQRALFHEQTTAAMTLKTYGSLIAGGLLLMLGGMVVYSHLLVRRIGRDEWAKSYYLKVLHEAEARTRVIIETAADGIITIDTRGRVDTFNSAAERIFGYNAEEVIGHNVTLLMPSPFREEHNDYLSRYLQTGESKVIGRVTEVEGQRKDGTVFPMDLSVSAVQVGGMEFFTGIVRDITGRKRAEEVQKVRDHFAKFVPEAVKQLVAANPDAPELAKREDDVSVLFLDISGYTRLSEHLPSHVLNQLIERYFSTFLDCIHEAGGDINETAGDGFMAIFQAPEPQRHALVAVESALALMAATDKLNADNLEHPLTVHMGLNSGATLVGSTRFEGSWGTRWTFTASGPVTNLAARLAGIAPPGQILAGAETVHRLGSRYHLQRLSQTHLKNFTEAVDVYRILGPATETQSGSRTDGSSCRMASHG